MAPFDKKQKTFGEEVSTVRFEQDLIQMFLFL